MTFDLSEAKPDDIWEITGRYNTGNDAFVRCRAVVLDPGVHGTSGTVFSLLPPLGWEEGGRVILPSQIAHARLVFRSDTEAREVTDAEVEPHEHAWQPWHDGHEVCTDCPEAAESDGNHYRRAAREVSRG